MTRLPNLRRWPLALITSALLARPLLAAPAIHTDAAARAVVEAQGQRLVEAIATDDSTERTAAVAELLMPASLAADGAARFSRFLATLRQRYGTLEFHHAEAVTADDPGAFRASLHVYVRCGSDGRWRDLQFYLDPAPPHRIRTIAFIADVTEPIYLPNGDVTDASTLAWLRAYMDRLAERDDFAGGLLLAVGDEVIFERVVGFADSARRRPMQAVTRFDLASGAKMFTALAVAQMVEAGRLSFGDTIARVVPALAGHAFAHSVSVGQLLSHTSGVGEFWTPEYAKHWDEWRTLDQLLPWVLRAGVTDPPGTRYAYSNSNFVLAGMVTEALAGHSWDTVQRTQIFEPLGMTQTQLVRYDPADTTTAERLAGAPRAWRRARRAMSGSPAGGSVSTLRDMLRFTRALVNGRIVGRAMLAEMTRSHTSSLPVPGEPYGFGFELSRSPGGVRSWGHGGIASGANFALRHFPDLDLTLIAFGNQDNGAFDDLRRNAIRLVTGER